MPTVCGWPKRTVETARASFETDFPEGRAMNIGVLLGDASGGLADGDLDCPEAIALAPVFLPPTRTFGRESKPRSHWLYIAKGAPTVKFEDPAGKGMLVELRANGGNKRYSPVVITCRASRSCGPIPRSNSP